MSKSLKSFYKEIDSILLESLKKSNVLFESVRFEMNNYVKQIEVLRANKQNSDFARISEFVERLYNGIDKFNTIAYEEIAKKTYDKAWEEAEEVVDAAERKKDPITIAWVLAIMATFNPIVKYVYESEVKAKADYFFKKVNNALQARANLDKELTMYGADMVSIFREAKRLWSNMTDNTMVFLASNAAVKAYKDAGVKRVRYDTINDDRRTEICTELDGSEIDIDEIKIGVNAPPMHYNCRSWLTPIE